MRKKKRYRLTADEIFQIWKQSSVDKKPFITISKDMSLPYHLVAGTPERLEKYINVETNIRVSTYKEAAQMARVCLLRNSKPMKKGLFRRLTEIVFS